MKSLFCIVAVFMSLSVYGQGITVKKVAETAYITASKYERKDGNGKACAVIKVEVPSLEGLLFDGSIGDTSHSSGVYYVYTSPGITTLPVFSGNEKVCEIDFSAHGIKYVYALTAEGYNRMDGSFTYSDEDDSQNTLNIDMERKTVPVTFICNAKKFDVIVDDETHSVKNNGVVYIPVGANRIRVVAPEYEDWVETRSIPDSPCKVSVTMKKSSSVSKAM